MRVSSTGNAAHSIRSINVRANILSEWTSNQVRYRTETMRYSAAIFLCFCTVVFLVPVSETARDQIAAVAKHDEAVLSGLKKDLAEATEAKKTAEPKVATAELHAQTSAYFNRMLGEMYQVLDSAKSGMAFSSAKAEVRAAEVVIDCRADAENYDVAAAFADQAGSTPNTISNLASTRPNTVLSPSGIAFEYFKRVALQ